MRTPTMGDVVAAARMLLLVPRRRRMRRMRRLVNAARKAERYRRRRGSAHPRHGTGSLMAAAGGWPMAPEPFLDDREYLDCLACAIRALAEVADVAGAP